MVVSRCAGIDIGKAEVVVCLRIPGPRGKRVSQVRTFSAVAVEMNRLADWLAEAFGRVLHPRGLPGMRYGGDR